jgi:hypothetical protein
MQARCMCVEEEISIWNEVKQEEREWIWGRKSISHTTCATLQFVKRTPYVSLFVPSSCHPEIHLSYSLSTWVPYPADSERGYGITDTAEALLLTLSHSSSGFISGTEREEKTYLFIEPFIITPTPETRSKVHSIIHSLTYVSCLCEKCRHKY